jgi:hypothetical protein
MGKPKGGKVLVHTRDQTPFLPLSGTRKVVRTPTTPLETVVNGEDFFPKDIITRRIQDIILVQGRTRTGKDGLTV